MLAIFLDHEIKMHRNRGTNSAENFDGRPVCAANSEK